jgi:uncharacterized protein
VTLDVLFGSFAICRLDPDASPPDWASSATFASVTRTARELSIVCASGDVPEDATAQRGFRGLVVRGPLDFRLVGIMAALAGTLARAAISIFVVSTYDTDYLFVREGELDRAVAALRAAGHTVTNGAATPAPVRARS